MFLLDTDHLSLLQRQAEPECSNIYDKMSAFAASQFFCSIVSFQEQLQGWQAELARVRTSVQIVFAYQRLRSVLHDFAKLQVLDYDQAASLQFDSLHRNRINIGTLDLRIAAIVLVHNFTVLTRNVRDFKKVPGLLVDDWMV